MFLGGTLPSVDIHMGNLVVRTGAREVAVGNCVDLGAVPLYSGQDTAQYGGKSTGLSSMHAPEDERR